MLSRGSGGGRRPGLYSWQTGVLLAGFALFIVLRLALYLVHHGDFNTLGWREVLAAFMVGLRFDASIIAITLGLPLLMTVFPIGNGWRVYWQRFWGWVTFLVLMGLLFSALVNLIYFGVVHRHVGAEIGAVMADMGSLSMLAVQQYWGTLLLFVALLVLGAWAWRRQLDRMPVAPVGAWRAGVHVVLGLLLLMIVARGGVGGKPISVGDAFFSNSLPQGYLAMNGAFAVSRAILDRSQPPKTFMPEDEALAHASRYLSGDAVPAIDPQYPLFRRMTGEKRQRNVVVLMLESWSAIHIDAYRKMQGLAPLGVTPNFDRLAQGGRLYTHFYANGQRSIQGGAAILAGLPTLPGMPFLGEGLEQNRLSFLGELAQRQGYETLFLQSSDRASLRFDVIAARAGFSTYLGNEDIPELHARKKTDNTWGTWDHNTLQEASRRFAAATKPFLGFVFTSTTHTPWLIPDAKWKKYAGDTDREKALNAIHYADWALGELIAAARRDGYHDDTVFVVTADHASEFVENTSHIPNLFHIPLLLAGPGVVPGRDVRVGSQVDIPPTVADLAGWTTAYAGAGRSLLDESRPGERAALVVRDQVLDWITPKGWVSHDLNRRVGAAPGLTAQELDAMEKDLLALYQVLTRVQLDNRLEPPQTGGKPHGLSRIDDK